MASREGGSQKILGVPQYIYTSPLWWALKEKPGFRIQSEIPANLAVKLRHKQLHGALLTPIDYARDYAMYRIIPHVAVSSRGRSNSILLTFTKGLRSIHTIAVNPTSTSEIVLTQIVLVEKYDLHPTFVPISPGMKHSQTDATLHVGDPTALPDSKDAIDIVDEWTDMSELPYVHSIWVSSADALTSSEMNTIVEVGRLGGSNPADVLTQALAQSGTVGWPTEHFSSFEYSLDEEKVSALTEFLRMAYYHGILHDIADVKMHEFESDSQSFPSPDNTTRN